jgi:hypothetical protein
MTDPRTAAEYSRTYEPNGERAYVALPLLRDGRWVAELWISDDVPRDWSEQEIALLQSVAERTWTAVEKLRVELERKELLARSGMADPATVQKGIESIEQASRVQARRHPRPRHRHRHRPPLPPPRLRKLPPGRRRPYPPLRRPRTRPLHVRHLTEAHAGSVHAASNGPGHGAEFTVRLPRAFPLSDPAPPRETATPIDRSALAGVPVLLVDDDPGAREILGTMLTGFGATVTPAASAAEAVQHFTAATPTSSSATSACPTKTATPSSAASACRHRKSPP